MSVQPRRKALTGQNFTVKEMWKLSQRSNQVWGVSGYEVPVNHFDSAKSIRDKKNYSFSTGKAKRVPEKLDMKVARGGIFDDIKKKTDFGPAPWNYDISQSWIKGHKKYANPYPAPKQMQKFKYKWKKTKEGEEQKIEEPPKVGGKENKPDKSTNRNTFIDQIIARNSKKRYPMPSPASYFMSEQTIKKLDEEKFALMEKKMKKEEKKDHTCPQSERVLSLIKNPKENAAKPGPGKYDIRKDVKVPEKKMDYKAYKNKLKTDAARRRENNNRLKEKIEEKKNTIKGELPKFPEPLPADYVTFSKYKHIYKGVSGKKKPENGRGFTCSAPRFRAPENERWKKTVGNHNAPGVEGLRTLDEKKDPTPGPAQYNLTAHWTRKSKKKGGDSKKLPNIFKTMSKGPSFSIYHKS